ncbi:MAG: hypothetical protein EOO73_27515 [Myxococcales bacterium]|nr:MAG: hypothetical protein EOO73_27515 [Myxococcales bacterium]
MIHTYFRVELTTAKRAGPQWRAAATIFRADTDEPVQRLAAKAPTAAEAEAQLNVAVAGALAELAPPADWGRDPTVPRLVRRWLHLRDEVYGMVERAEQGAEAYDRSERGLLQAQVRALTDAQRLELVTATADQLEQLADPNVQDILAAKDDLARLMAQPSPEVRAAHDALRAALDGAE